MNKFFKIPSVNLLVGIGGSGKSETIKHILRKYFIDKVFHYCIVFCSIAVEHKYKEFLPEEYVYTSFSEEIILKILMIQTHLLTTVGKVSCVIIFDDVGSYSSKFSKRCPTLVQLFTENKNFNITIFVALQSPSLIKSDAILSNVSYAWIYRLDSENDYKDVYKNFGQRFTTWRLFKQWIERNTGNYYIVVYNRKNLKNPYIVYHHSLTPNFRLLF